ncbi:hypothetical protein DM02DRAFT_540014, partial [Periconia macrospinosa]
RQANEAKINKKKRIQHGGLVEYGETSMQVAAESSMAAQRLKRARGGVGQEKAQSGQRRCGNCRKAGHNVRTC